MTRRIMTRLVVLADYFLYMTGRYHTRPKLELWAADHGWCEMWLGRQHHIDLYRKQKATKQGPWAEVAP